MATILSARTEASPAQGIFCEMELTSFTDEVRNIILPNTDVSGVNTQVKSFEKIDWTTEIVPYVKRGITRYAIGKPILQNDGRVTVTFLETLDWQVSKIISDWIELCGGPRGARFDKKFLEATATFRGLSADRNLETSKYIYKGVTPIELEAITVDTEVADPILRSVTFQVEDSQRVI